jgi:hypothetical protein
VNYPPPTLLLEVGDSRVLAPHGTKWTELWSLFHALYRIYANNRNPSCLMLMEALWSLSIKSPHSHIRSERDKSFFTFPQREHVLEEGNHLSIFISFFPCSSNLYCRKVVNMPHAWFAMLLSKWRDCAILFMLRSSITTQSYCFASVCDT